MKILNSTITKQLKSFQSKSYLQKCNITYPVPTISISQVVNSVKLLRFRMYSTYIYTINILE